MLLRLNRDVAKNVIQADTLRSVYSYRLLVTLYVLACAQRLSLPDYDPNQNR